MPLIWCATWGGSRCSTCCEAPTSRLAAFTSAWSVRDSRFSTRCGACPNSNLMMGLPRIICLNPTRSYGFGAASPSGSRRPCPRLFAIPMMNPPASASLDGSRWRCERESRINLALQMAERLEREGDAGEDGGLADIPSKRPSKADPEIPPEAKAQLIRTAMERHFQGLADAKLPIFGGRSAREAARDPASRPAVVSWVKDQWNNTIGLGQRDGTQ